MKKPSKAAPASVTDTLDRLKAYTEFESVTIGPDGSVSVKYAPKVATPKKQEAVATVTAIDSLGMTHPPFQFARKR